MTEFATVGLIISGTLPILNLIITFWVYFDAKKARRNGSYVYPGEVGSLYAIFSEFVVRLPVSIILTILFSSLSAFFPQLYFGIYIYSIPYVIGIIISLEVYIHKYRNEYSESITPDQISRKTDYLFWICIFFMLCQIYIMCSMVLATLFPNLQQILFPGGM